MPETSCFHPGVLASGTGTAHRKSDTRHGAFSDRCAQQNKFWAQKSRLHILNVLQKLTPYTEKYNCSLSNLIIYLTAASLPDLHVLCGARKPEQIIDNVKTLSLNLEEADLSEMSQLFEQLRNSIR